MKSTKMKKINLKNILKKTFKKNKKIKSKKKISSIKVKKKKIKPKKNPLKLKKIKKEIIKNENLRIPKTSELKPEIKKIKKQETAKKEFKVKDYVVYPKHGVGKITAIEKATIGQIEIQFYKIYIEREKLTLTVPINQQSNLRPISSINQINKCVSILKTKPKIRRTMWSRRAQEYEQKITSGKIYDLAEVVRDLNKGDDIMIDQSYSERQLFEKAYERILSEFQIVLNLSFENTQKKLDKALKRNADKNVTTQKDSKNEVEINKDSPQNLGENEDTGLGDNNENEEQE